MANIWIFHSLFTPKFFQVHIIFKSVLRVVVVLKCYEFFSIFVGNLVLNFNRQRCLFACRLQMCWRSEAFCTHKIAVMIAVSKTNRFVITSCYAKLRLYLNCGEITLFIKSINSRKTKFNIQYFAICGKPDIIYILCPSWGYLFYIPII